MFGNRGPLFVVFVVDVLTTIAWAANSCLQTALILTTTDAGAADQATTVIQGYSTPLQVFQIPQAGISLPVLETISGSDSKGNYGLIIIVGLVSYNYGGTTGWASAITPSQWTQLYNYQTKYGVRMVHLDAFPQAMFGTTTTGPAGCCASNVEQWVSLTDNSFIPTAGLKVAPLSTKGLWHYPAVVTDKTGQTVPIMVFSTSAQYPTQSVAGVRQKIPNGSGFREQMAIFLEGGSWSLTTSYICHIWFHWGYRGLYLGYRRLGLNTQVDDMFLETENYVPPAGTPNPDGIRTRVSTADLDNHITWSQQLQSTMNPGSSYFIEIGFNGDGNEDYASNNDPSGTCADAMGFDDPIGPATNAEFKKPLGTGVSSWPQGQTYVWTKQCTLLDPLATYVQNTAKRDAFGWISHTFTHEALDNATFYDVNKEITFNQQHASILGLSNSPRWSKGGLIPPAITGLHNGDALNAFWTNGLVHGVGDNTRPLLRNPFNTHLPLITTIAASNFAGFTIIPRWATRIYYNWYLKVQKVINTSGNMAQDAAQWRSLSPSEAAGTAGDIYALLQYEKQGAVSNLMSLHRGLSPVPSPFNPHANPLDPFMFHQINLRVTDVSSSTINGITKKRSLLQMWAETVIPEFVRLVKWPLITTKQDDLYGIYTNRLKRSVCNPNVALIYTTSAGVTKITGFTVSCINNNCPVAIPVTIPGGGVTNLQGSGTEQVGSDPLNLWIWLSGAAKTFTLTQPITI